MPYVNQRDATERLKKITKNDRACIKQRMHRFYSCVPSNISSRGDVLNWKVLGVSPDLSELLSETVQIEIVRFLELHPEISIPPDTHFWTVAELWMSYSTHDEAASCLAQIFPLTDSPTHVETEIPA